MNLYQINKEYEEILNELYDEEGVVNETALARLEQNSDLLKNKAIAISSYVKNLEAEREAIKNAKSEMSKREKVNKKKEEELLGFLQFSMEKHGIQSISCPYFNIKLKKCPISVDDDHINMDLLPSEYKRTKIEISPDKIKMLQEMKMGVVIPGAAFKQNMTLQIK